MSKLDLNSLRSFGEIDIQDAWATEPDEEKGNAGAESEARCAAQEQETARLRKRLEYLTSPSEQKETLQAFTREHPDNPDGWLGLAKMALVEGWSGSPEGEPGQLWRSESDRLHAIAQCAAHLQSNYRSNPSSNLLARLKELIDEQESDMCSQLTREEVRRGKLEKKDVELTLRIEQLQEDVDASRRHVDALNERQASLNSAKHSYSANASAKRDYPGKGALVGCCSLGCMGMLVSGAAGAGMVLSGGVWGTVVGAVIGAIGGWALRNQDKVSVEEMKGRMEKMRNDINKASEDLHGKSERLAAEKSERAGVQAELKAQDALIGSLQKRVGFIVQAKAEL